jgi:hypothetical protein
MFNQNTSADTKIAVLEERLSAYEIMMNKIDEAIQIMGKASQDINKMLAVHEEKIDQCNKADDYNTRIIDELRVENKDQHASVEKRIDGLETKIDDMIKLRWMFLGAAVVLSFALSHTPIFIDLLTSNTQPSGIVKPQ